MDFAEQKRPTTTLNLQARRSERNVLLLLLKCSILLFSLCLVFWPMLKAVQLVLKGGNDQVSADIGSIMDAHEKQIFRFTGKPHVCALLCA